MIDAARKADERFAAEHPEPWLMSITDAVLGQLPGGAAHFSSVVLNYYPDGSSCTGICLLTY